MLHPFFLKKITVIQREGKYRGKRVRFKDYKRRFSVTSSLVKLLHSFSEMEINAEKIITVNRAMQVRKKACKNSGLPGVEP